MVMNWDEYLVVINRENAKEKPDNAALYKAWYGLSVLCEMHNQPRLGYLMEAIGDYFFNKWKGEQDGTDR